MSGASEIAAQAVIDAENAEARAANAEATTAAVIAAASETIDETQRQAAAIAEAAMNTELGRRIGAIEQEFRTWLDQNGQRLLSQVAQLEQELGTLRGQIAGLAEVQILTQTAPSPLIPPASQTLEEATEPLTEVLPSSVSAVVENPAQPMPEKRKTRFL